MTNSVKISELPDLANLNNSTIIPVVDNGSNKKITAEVIANYVGTRPGTQGATGARGPQGPTGLAGPSGPRGYSGSEGSGYVGSQGVIGYTGSEGPTGAQGNQGDIGYAGSQGELGYTGSVGAGYTGSRGIQGEAGPSGPLGLRGPSGPSGPIGPAGPQGVQGNIGDIGYTGSRGLSGATGASGVAGPSGASGVAGPSGASGVAGPSGASGVAGPSGAQGPTGASGPSGDLGYTGSKGDVGPGINVRDSINLFSELEFYPTVGLSNGDALVILELNRVVVWNGTQWIDAGEITGPVGPIGPVGFTGSRGFTGFVGSAGSVGPSGDLGYTGSQGITGYDGSRGDLGYTGSQGLEGPTGPQGEAGPQGIQGPSGAQGIQGPQGPIGLTGLDGIEGPTGPTGPTGVTGEIGYTGSQGPVGFEGSRGSRGYTGSHGDIGFTGSTGAGYTGSQGLIGPPGAGFAGSQGFEGSRGYTGSQGVTGIPGPIGFAGSQGFVSGLRYRTDTGNVNLNIGRIKLPNVSANLIANIAINSVDFSGFDQSDYLSHWQDGFIQIFDVLGSAYTYSVSNNTFDVTSNAYVLSLNYFGGNAAHTFGNLEQYSINFTPRGFTGSKGILAQNKIGLLYNDGENNYSWTGLRYSGGGASNAAQNFFSMIGGNAAVTLETGFDGGTSNTNYGLSISPVVFSGSYLDLDDKPSTLGKDDHFTEIAGASGTVNHNCFGSTRIFYHTNVFGNFTANLINFGLANNYTTTITLVIAQGATGYIADNLSIAGVPQTINWYGGTVPTPGINNTDFIKFTIMKTATAYMIYGQLSSF